MAVGIIQADGQQNLQRIGLLGNQGDDGDPFPGGSKRKYLNHKGFPNSLDYDGNPTGFGITGVTWKNNVCTGTAKAKK